MVLLVLPLVLGQGEGWPAWTWACLAASVPAFALLWAVERRSKQPLVDPGLLARPAIGWGLASQAAGTATYFAVLFTLALYLQQGLGKSAGYSGLALVSWVAAFGLPGPVLGRLAGRARALAAPAGSLILAAGFAGLAACLLAGNTNGIVLITLLGVAGLGLGTAFTGMLSHLTSSVSGEHAGEHAAALSGLFNTATRAGGVIGTAAFGTLYLALVHHRGAGGARLRRTQPRAGRHRAGRGGHGRGVGASALASSPVSDLRGAGWRRPARRPWPRRPAGTPPASARKR